MWILTLTRPEEQAMNSQFGIRQSSWKQWVGGLAAASIIFHPSMDISWAYGPEEEMITGLYSLINIIAVIIGAILGAVLADIFGRKPILLATLIFVIPRLIFVIFEEADWAWIVQILIQFGSGITCTVVPLYISEIASTNNRGNLLVLQLLAYSIGVAIMIVLSGIFGLYELSLNVLTIINGILLAISVLFHAITLSLFPETPQYLNSQKRYQEAAKSLAFFTENNHVKIREDANQLLINSQINNKRQGCCGKICELMRFENRRSLAMIFSLIVIRWASGQFRNNLVLFNLTNFLDGSDSIYILIGTYGIKLILTIFTLFAISVLQRKISLILVILVCFVAAIICIPQFQVNLWILFVFLFVQHFGHLILIGVTLAYTGEFFSINVRAIAIAVVISFEVLMRNIFLMTGTLMPYSALEDDVVQISYLLYYLTCGVFFAAFFFLLIFFPKTNNLRNFEIPIEPAAGGGYLP